MAKRRMILLMASLSAGILAASWFEVPKSAAQQQATGAQVADLQEQLEDGLKARVPADFAFIARVVEMVEEGELPRPLVQSTFHWVRKTKWNKKYLVPYFEQALRLRAAKLGIEI